jgi:glycosyltransferase involved in cell wall biosynthesis
MTPNIPFQEYTTTKGEILLYTGTPNCKLLEELSKGCGDVWHSSLDQGFANAFPELIYQTAIYFWHLNDLKGFSSSVSWRINPYQFAIRKSVWELVKERSKLHDNPCMAAFDIGFNLIRYQGGTVLYSKGLYPAGGNDFQEITAKDRYTFFVNNFKKQHAYYMLFRKGVWHWKEWQAFSAAQKKGRQQPTPPVVPVRPLDAMQGTPTVSYIIPTMMRQEWTQRLLMDLAHQTYVPTEVIIVDATPEAQRIEGIYTHQTYPFALKTQWQTTQGSCRARNEALSASSGEYIIFGDDDIRIPNDFVASHIRFLQTYGVPACNGLDIRADHQEQNLTDLTHKLEDLGKERWKSGVSYMFSNANSCVHRSVIEALVGNDINYDGGYGEDSDFGFSIFKAGMLVLHNPYAVNLHLKPPVGGYRFWGKEASKKGKARKKQPWELDRPVTGWPPIPSPTIMYFNLKHYPKEQVREYQWKYFFMYFFKNHSQTWVQKIIQFPKRWIQYRKSVFYAQQLLALGKRTK